MVLIPFGVQIVAKPLELRTINAMCLVHEIKPDSSALPPAGARHARRGILSHLGSLDGYDEPEFLRYRNLSTCPKIADARQCGGVSAVVFPFTQRKEINHVRRTAQAATTSSCGYLRS